MSIIRPRLAFQDHFTQIPNEWLRDARLTRKARGLLAELLTHRDGWEVTIESLMEAGLEGRDAIRAAITELEVAGYLRRERARGEAGKLAGSNYVLQDPWIIPTSENPTLADPTLDKQPTKNTMLLENQVQEHKPPSRRKPALPLQEQWVPNNKHSELAAKQGVSLQREAEAFRLHAQTNDRRAANWDAAFSMWLTKAGQWKTGQPIRAGDPVYHAPKLLTPEESLALDKLEWDRMEREGVEPIF